MKDTIAKITEMAVDMREDALTMAYASGMSAAHVGGGLSIIDILAVLYGGVMKYNVANPTWNERDRFILSKGHGVIGYYAALCESGFISKDELCSFEKNNSDLLGHPVQNIEKGMEFTTGSLGQGLSIGIGVALSLRDKGIDSKAYVLMGDGECNEGSVWEAFMSAAQYKLDNIVAIIDRNRYQLGGETMDVMDIGNVGDKLRAFGWEVREVNGHNVEELYNAFTEKKTDGKPLAVVANTKKGYGFSFMEENNSWHHAVLTKDNYEKAMSELGRDPKTEKIDEAVAAWNKKEDKGVLSENQESQILSRFGLTPQFASRWSVVGQRAAFGLAAIELAKENYNIKILTADVSTSAGLARYAKKYCDNYLDVGIAEQNMMGIASGMASMGYDVITTTFAPFQSMRCLEQIRVNYGYMKNKVVMVGLASGLVLGTLGSTHCCFEDMGVLRSIPNIAIVSPADCGEVGKALFAAVDYNQSVYIRLMGGANCPIVYNQDYDFEIGKSIVLKESNCEKVDVTVFACGTMVNKSLEAFEILEEAGITSRIVNMHTIKPIDENAIVEACNKSKLIVTVEEHSIYGGLGSAVAEVKATLAYAPRQLTLGIPDKYGHGATYSTLLEKYGLTSESIAKMITEKVKE